MFAIITTGGKQYKVTEQDIIFVEKLNCAEGEEVTFDVVAMSTEEGFKVGTPTVEGAKVTGLVQKNGKGKKIYVMTLQDQRLFESCSPMNRLILFILVRTELYSSSDRGMIPKYFSSRWQNRKKLG